MAYEHDLHKLDGQLLGRILCGVAEQVTTPTEDDEAAEEWDADNLNLVQALSELESFLASRRSNTEADSAAEDRARRDGVLLTFLALQRYAEISLLEDAHTLHS